MWGLIPAQEAAFTSAVQNMRGLDTAGPLLGCMATCHSLITIGGQLNGDPLDLKMFASTGWEMDEPGEDNEKVDKMITAVVKPPTPDNADGPFSIDALPFEIGITRQFPFSSTLARMSVIVRRLGSRNFTIFTKGAPEKLDRKVNWVAIQKMKRTEVESELTFLGFLVMQNTLKPESEPVITELKDAAIRCVMVTGDNLLTALSVARDCAMVGRQDRVVVGEAELVRDS